MTPDARCVDHTCSDGPPVGDQPAPRLAVHGTLLCRRHSDALERNLAEWPARRDLLRQSLGGLTSRSRGENKPTKGSPPVPLNIDAHDLLEQARVTVVGWVGVVTEERDLRGPDRDDTAHLARWLLSQLPWIVAQPWVDDLADEMRDLSREADRVTASRARWNRLEAPCPDCDAHELGRWDGDDAIGCASCGTTWTPDQYRHQSLVVVLAATVTAAQAVERLGVEPDVFRQWVSRGKVRKVGTIDGQARYSAADVQRHEKEAS